MLTVIEAARAAGRSPDLVRRWLRQERVSGVRTSSGEWLIPADALSALSSFPRTRRRRPAA
jgi:transposase-like protein